MYESKKINNKKYDKMHIKQLAMSMKKEEAEIIQQNAQKYNMSTSLFCRKCIRYIIDHNIDISDIELQISLYIKGL